MINEKTEKTQRIFRQGYLQVENLGHVAVIVMDRPEKLNAMTAEFWGDLRAVIGRLAEDPMIRVAIITGGGERAFSAGGDIPSFLSLQTDAEIQAYQKDAMAAFHYVETSPVIVIAAVNGLAYGGGCELALACDVVIAAANALFAMPEATLGLVPGFGAVRAPEVVGRHLAKYMITTGAPIDAERAYQVGFVQKVVAEEGLMAESLKIAQQMSVNSPTALAAGKHMINSTIDRSMLDYSVSMVTKLQMSRDQKVGVAAFINGGTPEFGAREDLE
jgi:enoyl-CoA hydratase